MVRLGTAAGARPGSHESLTFNTNSCPATLGWWASARLSAFGLVDGLLQLGEQGASGLEVELDRDARVDPEVVVREVQQDRVSPGDGRMVIPDSDRGEREPSVRALGEAVHRGHQRDHRAHRRLPLSRSAWLRGIRTLCPMRTSPAPAGTTACGST